MCRRYPAAQRCHDHERSATMSRLIAAAGALALGLLLPPPAGAATDADLADIREQIRQLKEAYEARIEALERRLKDAETKTAQTPTEAAAPKAAAAPATAPSPDTPVNTSANAFNPAISA